MRRIVASLVALLPWDPRSQRALEETLQDWKHETNEASGWRRWLVSLSAPAALARVMAGCVVVEIRTLPWAWLVMRLFAFGVVPSIILVLAQMPRAWFPLSALQTTALLALLVPTMLMLVPPLSLFYIAAFPPRQRPLPAVGMAAAVFAMALTIGAWTAPEANQQFRQTTYSLSLQQRPGDRAVPPARGPSELLPRELIKHAWDQPTGPAMHVLLVKSGLMVLSTAFVLLGATISVLPAPARRRWLLVGPGLVFLFIAAPSSPVRSLVPWGVAALSLLIVAGLRRGQQSDCAAH